MEPSDTSHPDPPEPPYGHAPPARHETNSLLDSLEDGYFEVDLGGRLVVFNRALSELSGYLPEELKGLRYQQYTDSETAQRLFQAFNRVYRTGEPLRKLGFELMHRDGAYRSVEVSVSLIRGSRQQPCGFRGILRDVSERKQAEAALTRERNLLRTVIDLLPEQIYVKDSQSRFLMCNPAVARKAGAQSEADMIGKTDFDFSPRELAETYFADEQAILRSGRPLINREEPIVDAQTGARRWNLTSKVPLRDGAGQVIGLAGVNHDITDRKRTEQELQRRADEFAALYETARALATEQDLPALLRATLEQATTLLNAPSGSIFLYDPTTGDQVLTVTKGTDARPGLRLKLGEGMAGRVGQTHVPLIVNDYSTWDLRSSQLAGTNLGAIVQVPMLFAGELIGVLGVGDIDAAKRTFGEVDARLLTLLAGQAASAVHNARLLEQTRRRADQLQAVSDVERATAAILEPETLLSHISNVIRTRLNLYGVVVGLIEGDELIFNAGSKADARGADRPAVRLKIGREGITGWVAASGESALVPDVRLDPRFVVSDYLPNTRSEFAVPLKTSAGIIGVLNMESDEVNGFTPELVGLVETLASQIASAIENARLFAETRRLARTDALTGIPNRRYLFELGEREVSRAQRFGHPLSALMLDIDHFKRVNDTYGHAQGDRVLQALVKGCLRQIRDIDIMGRYGGEEFVILLIETDLGGARTVAERVRESAAQMVMSSDQAAIRITLSAGIVSLGAGDADLDKLLGRADQALYAAKQAGRNRVEVGQPIDGEKHSTQAGPDDA
jgi:diguanylate cyclase (GGDEF)-like protein/PAS domain S-box-containing protein